MRPRKHKSRLPACVYQRGPSLWYVKRNKWTRLGPASDLPRCLAEYARLESHGSGGMAEMIEEMIPRITKGGRPATVKLYTLAARKLQEMLVDFAPHEVTPADVAQVRKLLSATPAMANRCVSVLNLIFQEAIDDRIIEVNPCLKAKREKLAKRTRALSLAEFYAIRDKASDRLRLVMDLCILTGQRISDVLNMRRSDCRDDGIYVQPIKTRNTTRVAVLIEWNAELRAAVDAAKRAHGRIAGPYVIKGRGGSPLAYQPVWRDWRAACDAAKVADATIHDVRALAASLSKRQGGNPQALLAHSSERMTANYLRERDAVVVKGPSIARKG